VKTHEEKQKKKNLFSNKLPNTIESIISDRSKLYASHFYRIFLFDNEKNQLTGRCKKITEIQNSSKLSA